MPQPWQENWEEVRRLAAGGQGTTSIVRSRTDGSEGVLKVLKSQDRKKARRRIADEVFNLRKVSDAGGNVPRVWRRILRSSQPKQFSISSWR